MDVVEWRTREIHYEFAYYYTQTTKWVAYNDTHMARNTAADDRTDTQKTEMAETFDEFEVEYREEPEHREVVHEDSECVIIADHTGHEINEWAAEFDVDREDLRSTFRAIADQKMDEQDAHKLFSHADPVVFDKLED